MADKGFDIKVLIPTDDGVTISEKQVDNVPYYLIYNVSNRSYQLAGKINTREIKGLDLIKEINQVLEKNKIDFIVSNSKNSGICCRFIKVEFSEINQMLNNLIDQIDQNKLT